MRRLGLATMLALSVVGCRRAAGPAAVTERSARGLSPAEATDLDPAPDVLQVRLTAAKNPEGSLFLYAYNGQNPGPTLRAKLGDTLVVELDNQLDGPTTIHWHGLHVPFEMDGVAWMRDPVGPGETFTYRFELQQAGTFWYHPHFDTDRQVEGGLHGVLIVEDPAEPATDEELVLVFDAADEPRHGSEAHGHGKIVTAWRVNGATRPTFSAQGGQTVRVRMLNASNAGYLALSGGAIEVIGGDQGLLSARARPERLVLGPGDRAELEWRLGTDGFTLQTQPYSLNGGLAYGEPIPVLDVAVSSPAPAPSPVAWPFDGAATREDPGRTDILYAFAGSDRTGRWLINGEAFPNVTIEELPLGEGAVIEVRNLSSSEHPFHVHGMSFEVLSVNGVAPATRQVEDTLNVRIRDVVRLYVEPTVVGDWMTHCHILPHAEDGMMTVLRVVR